MLDGSGTPEVPAVKVEFPDTDVNAKFPSFVAKLSPLLIVAVPARIVELPKE